MTKTPTNPPDETIQNKTEVSIKYHVDLGPMLAKATRLTTEKLLALSLEF